MLKGLYILGNESYDLIYGEPERAEIGQLVDIYGPQHTAELVQQCPEVLGDADVIFSGWGAPVMDARLLDHAPRLKAVFYGAGTIKWVVTDAFWERSILITSAYGANAVPVAEFTLSQILFCLKRGWHFVRVVRQDQCYPASGADPVAGAYGSVVGIISLGMVGRKVCELLRPFDLKVIAYDPYVDPAEAAALGAELSSLDDVFAKSDVVSLHSPRLPETEGMITGRHISLMKHYATFINTSRGAIVREGEMVEALLGRPDLQAVLDVTWPEPPEPDSPLYTMPNVALTPHIAGSMGNECRRMGRYMVEELKRYLKGEPLLWAISREKAAILA